MLISLNPNFQFSDWLWRLFLFYSSSAFHSFQVDQSALELLDELEGVTKGHYVRRPLMLTGLQFLEVDCAPTSEILAEAYFAHPSLQRGLSRLPHIEAYTKKETVNYVYRKDRPKNRTFLEHVNNWIDSQGPRSYIRL